MSTFKANLKKQGGKSEDEQNEMARKEEQSKAIDYATKKKEWKRINFPNTFLAFVLFGNPSKQGLISLQVGNNQQGTKQQHRACNLQEARG